MRKEPTHFTLHKKRRHRHDEVQKEAKQKQTKTRKTEDRLGFVDALRADGARGVEEGLDFFFRVLEEVAVRADVAVGVVGGGGRQTRCTDGLLVAEAVEVGLLLALLADSHGCRARRRQTCRTVNHTTHTFKKTKGRPYEKIFQ